MLHEFLDANRAELLSRCAAKTALRQHLEPAAQTHGVPVFLEQLIQRLRIDGGAVADDADIVASATRHGGELLRHGFSLDAVVRDYGDLCQSVTELAGELESVVTVDEFRTFNRCLDNAIAGAVTEFGRQRDEVVFANGQHTLDAEREAVRVARHELSELVRLCPVPMVVWRGPEHVYSVVNEAHDRMLGKNVIGKTMREAHTIAEAGDAPAMLDRVYQTGQRFSAKARAYTVTGDDGHARPIWVHEFFSPFLDLAGDVSGILGIAQDVTAEVLATKELSAVLNALPAYIARIDAQERLVFASENISARLSLSHVTIGTTLREALGELYGGFAGHIATVLRGESVEFQWSRPPPGDEHPHHFMVNLCPERVVDGRVSGFVACVFNVETMKLAKLKLQDSLDVLTLQAMSLEAERELRQRFVATMSHDLRTPLAAARMASYLLTEQPDNAQAVGRLAAIIATNIDRADKMIIDLLDANRLQAGESLPVELEPCTLNEIVTKTLEELAATHGPRFQLQATEQLHGYWDPGGIRRVVENLCGNAIKYGDRKSVVTVSISRDEDVAVLSVHNDGAPISASDQQTLFDQHRRTDSARTSGQQGWGLGLTLVKAIVESHGGHVDVESSPEHGTTFRVYVPVDARRPPCDGEGA